MNAIDERSDARLLGRFLESRDEEAFEALVRRHEAMVLGVCVRVLRDEHAARDAAQAVFLALAKKGASLDLRRPLGPWLHHVAYGVAVSARREREARRKRELTSMTQPQPLSDTDLALRELLDLELDRLPDSYRRSLVLFHLEGRSLEETAEELGRPLGTVGAWLSRGRDLLRDRLSRRGLGAVSTALLAGLLAREASAHAAGWGFARTAARAAAGGAVPPSVALMTQGAMTMLMIARLKAAGLAIAAAGAFTVANLAYFAHAPAPTAVASTPTPAESAPPPIELPHVIVTFEATEVEASLFPPSTDLVGHWKLDDDKVEDAGGGAAGKLLGAATFAEGKLGKALKVDGKGARVELPNTEALEKVQENSYTLAAWFKPEAVPAGKDDANDAAYGIVMKTGWHTGLNYNNEKKYTFCHWLEGAKPEEPTWVGAGGWDTDYEPGTWVHLVGVVDRPAGKLMLYIDGELSGTAEFTANAPARKYEKTTWKIGTANPDASSYAWPAKGWIDDVRIYGRALSAGEIKTLYSGK